MSTDARPPAELAPLIIRDGVPSVRFESAGGFETDQREWDRMVDDLWTLGLQITETLEPYLVEDCAEWFEVVPIEVVW